MTRTFAALWLVLAACGPSGHVRTPGEGDPDESDSDSDDGSEGTEGTDEGSEGTEPDPGPTIYRWTQRSPISAHVVAEAEAIAARAEREEDVFMKVGASGTVSTNLLYCFAGETQPQYDLDLDGRDELLPTIEAFRGGDADGATPFDRVTLAAVSGKTAQWAITGSPSPLEEELDALSPRYAFVNYGTNDMGMGSTPQTALWPFVESYGALLDQLIDEGVIPIVTGLNPRDGTATTERWVPTYDVVTMGLAQERQVPFFSLYLATKDLADQGLLSDGIHGNVLRVDGKAQPCVFTAGGLEYNYNVRNLASIGMLHDLTTIRAGAPAQAPGPALKGSGTQADPFVVDELPFTHHGDTTGAEALVDGWPACDSGQDESGGEVYYRFELSETTALRIMAFSREGADIDVHLLSGDDPESCEARHDKILQETLGTGTWTLALDSFTPGSGVPAEGGYLLVVTTCEDGDPDCD